jgi:hypothetical protein
VGARTDLIFAGMIHRHAIAALREKQNTPVESYRSPNSANENEMIAATML